MATIKNVFGEDRVLSGPVNRLVLDGQEIEVPDEEVYSYTQQTGWEPVGTAAQELHDVAHAQVVEAQRVADGVPAENLEPSGNASEAEWRAYVLAAHLATEDELAGLGRNEIRDTYKSKEN